MQTETESRVVSLFCNGRNQSVRIPVEFELPGTKAIMRREGDRLVIEPMRKCGPAVLLASWEPLGPEDQFLEIEDFPVKPEESFEPSSPPRHQHPI
jgi:antitoxin VapB